MKTKTFSVKLESLISISPKAYKAVSFDGGESVIPKSQVFGQDNTVGKSEAYWISEWILERKDLQFSRRKEAWFDSTTGKMLPSYTVVEHKPEKKAPVEHNEMEDLKRTLK